MIGVNFGDEGKGNTVDRLLGSGEYSMAARFNGGANAGHQLSFDGHEIALHQVPSGIAHPGVLNIIGNGSYVDPVGILEEFDAIEAVGLKMTPGNFVISDTAHLVLPHHKILDRLAEAGASRQGSTAKGIRYVAADKYERKGARGEMLALAPEKLEALVIAGLEQANNAIVACSLTEKEKTEKDLQPVDPKVVTAEWMKALRALEPFFADTFVIIHERMAAGQNLLAEGAQAIGLDMEHGIYKLNTSSHTTPGGAMNGLGISTFRRVIGVTKLTMSRVGGDPKLFVTLVTDETVAERLRGRRGDVDAEFGKSTGRSRDMGYPDNTLIKRARELGVNELVLTKLDLVPRYGKEVKFAVAYEMNGKHTEYTPNSALKLAACKPIYESLPTWEEDISSLRDYAALPEAARNLVAFVEKDTNLPVTAVGVGPSREQVIFRD